MTQSLSCAVVVAYQPDAKILALLASMRGQFDRVVVCDNGMTASVTTRDVRAREADVTILDMGGNKGVAYALNRGVEFAVEQGCEFVCLFDQDSLVPPNFTADLLATYDHLSRSGHAVGLVCPIYRDVNTDLYSAQIVLRPWSFSRAVNVRDEIVPVTLAVTSGSLLHVRVFEHVGRFVEDLFIDYVDHEFCLRLRRAGYEVFMDTTVVMRHSYGEKQERRVGPLRMYPTNHGVLRKYYVSRNRVYCVRRYGRELAGFVMFEVLAALNDVVRVALFERQRRAKLSAILRGWRDGLTFRPRIEYR